MHRWNNGERTVIRILLLETIVLSIWHSKRLTANSSLVFTFFFETEELRIGVWILLLIISAVSLGEKLVRYVFFYAF